MRLLVAFLVLVVGAAPGASAVSAEIASTGMADTGLGPVHVGLTQSPSGDRVSSAFAYGCEFGRGAGAVAAADEIAKSGNSLGRGESFGLGVEPGMPLRPAVELNAPNTAQPGTALRSYYPANNGFYGTPKAATLQPGASFDRYGSDFGRFTSPTGTPMHQRALPPGAEDGVYSAFRVVEPLTVQAGQVAPAFNSFGGGTQYFLPKSVKDLLEAGIIERVTP